MKSSLFVIAMFVTPSLQAQTYVKTCVSNAAVELNDAEAISKEELLSQVANSAESDDFLLEKLAAFKEVGVSATFSRTAAPLKCEYTSPEKVRGLIYRGGHTRGRRTSLLVEIPVPGAPTGWTYKMYVRLEKTPENTFIAKEERAKAYLSYEAEGVRIVYAKIGTIRVANFSSKL